MWHILKQIVRTGIVTEPTPGVDDSEYVIIERMHRDIRDILGRADHPGGRRRVLQRL